MLFSEAATVDVLLKRWSFALVGAGVVLIAFLVNRFAPVKRRRVRRVVILYGLYLFAFGAAYGLGAVGLHAWAERLRLAASLLEAFTLVNLVALAIFDLALPAVRIDLVSITSDILVGIAYAVTAIGVFHASGMDPTSVVATSAVVGGILTFSLQNTLGNILGGVALQLDGSIHVGDWIALENGRQGKVKEIRWRHTVVETRDWDTIIVPNATLLSTNIMILGKREGQPIQHRMWVYFNVDFRYAPNQVIEAVETALLTAPIEGAALDPPPQCICYDFAKDTRDSFAYYAVRYWLTDLPHDDPTNSRVRTRIYTALKRAGIPLARPASTMFLKHEEDLHRRDERTRERHLRDVKGLEIFHGLTPTELDDVVAHLRDAPFAKGETVTKQGAVAHWLYILTRGKVEILAKMGGVSKAVATIEAPGFFGEMGLMTGEPRAADVIALTDVECYRLDKDGFQRILVERPEIAETMSKTLAHRRVELDVFREGLDAEAKLVREASEQQRILKRIQDFFGLDEEK